MKKLLPIAAMFLFAFYGCKKSDTKPNAVSNPATGSKPTAPSTLSIVVSKLTPATYLSLSLVNSKGVKVFDISAKNSDTTYIVPAINTGDQFEANIITNIKPAPGLDGVADVKFIYNNLVISEVSGGIYNKPDTIPVAIP